MLIRRSTYVHLTPLAEDRVLIVHAMTHLRLVIDAEVAGIVEWFAQARDMPGDLAALRATLTIDADTLAGALASLMERGVLTDLDPAGEEAAVAEKLSRFATSAKTSIAVSLSICVSRSLFLDAPYARAHAARSHGRTQAEPLSGRCRSVKPG